jgi:hypothetical protein
VRPWLAEPCICSSAHLLRSSACHFSRETEAGGCIHCNRHLPACALDERRLVAMNAPQMKTLQELGRSPTRPDPERRAELCSASPKANAPCSSNKFLRSSERRRRDERQGFSSLSVGQCSRNGRMLLCRASYPAASSFRGAVSARGCSLTLCSKRALFAWF